MSLVAMFASRRTKIPFVYQEHALSFGETLLKYPLRVSIMAKAKLIVVNSCATANMLRRRYPIINKNIRVIYNGVSLPIKKECYNIRDNLSVKQSTLLVGIIGGYLPLRRHAHLIKSFADVCKQLNDVHLVCLGEGASEENKVKELANKLLPENVHFLPRTQYIGSFLQELDVYVNPAIAEGFGIATCEAMLMGKAVIGANAGALPEYCMHGHNSILVPPDDQKSLTGAILMLLRDANLRQRLGANAQKDIIRRFSVELYVMNNNAVCYEAAEKHF